MKQILFIDFDQTLCHDRFWRSLPSDDMEKIQKYLFIDNRKIVGRWMRGEFTSEEINELLSRELQIAYDKMWSTFVRDCETMKILPEVYSQLDQLKAEYFRVLFTDNMDCFTRFTVPSLGLKRYFDKIVNSWDVKMAKNESDGKLYLDTAKSFGVEIGNSVLLDDSANSCETFSKLSGRVCRVTKEEPLTHWLGVLLKEV